IYTLQRTGGTNLTQRLNRRSPFKMAQNIAKIFSLSPEDAMARLLALPTVAYSEGRFTRQTAHASA
ncbi:MAG: hypothetical protein AAFY56_08005, partial [Pseudomonadota bacterium]